MVFYQDAGLQRAIRAQTDFFLLDPKAPVAGSSAPSRPRPMELEVRLAELSAFFSVFSFNMPLADLSRAGSIDAALAAGTKDFCLIQRPGHIFYGYDPLSYALKQDMERCDFAVGDAGAGLLINRAAWDRRGRPAFSNWTADDMQPWSAAVREACWMCDTAGSDIFAWLAAMDDITLPATGDDQLQASLARLRNIPDRESAPKKVFVFNSETDADLPQLRHRPGLDTAFVLASGFKTNRILETFGFHERTKIVVYDYSAPALVLRRMMVETWDGRDFAGFFARARTRVDAQFAGAVGFLPAAIIKDTAAVAAEFQREIQSVFTEPTQWLNHWERYRKLDHTYVEIDVIKDRSAAKAMIAGYARGHAVFWLSDMFNSPNAVGKYSWGRRRSAFDVIAGSLRETTASDLILGGAPALWFRP